MDAVEIHQSLRIVHHDLRRGDCLTGPEVACNDDRDATTSRSEITMRAEPGDYYVFVSGFEFAGAYELTVAEAP